jgi:hypothetical protein
VATNHNFRIKNGLEVGGTVIVSSSGVMTIPTSSTGSTQVGGTNNTSLATTAFVQQEITSLVASAPTTLNTLNELAAALGDDASFSTTVTNSIALKSPLASPTFTGTLIAPQIRVGDGTDGYFYSDQAGRTAFNNGDFYIQTGVTNYYNYATNQYHGNSSGDNHYFRGNPLSGNSWSITAAGVITGAGITTSANLVDLFSNQNGVNELRLDNNRQDISNVAVSKVSGRNGVETSNMTFYRGTGGSSGYIRFQTKPTNAASLTDQFQIGDSSTVGYGVNVPVGGYRINGTTVIDSSRNIDNIVSATIGNIELTGNGIGVQEAGFLFQPNSAYRCIHPTSMTTTSHTSDISLGWSNNKWKDIYLAGFVKADSGYQVGTTTVIDSNRVLTNLNGAIKSDSNFSFLTVADGAQNIRTKSVFAGTSYGDTPPAGSFNATNTYELNGTTVIDSSRNLNNINNIISAGNAVFGRTTLDPDSYTNKSGGFGHILDTGWGAHGLFVHGGGTGDAAAIAHNGSNLYFGIQNGSTANSMSTWMSVSPSRAVDMTGSASVALPQVTAGTVYATEYDLPSSGKLDWANGDARIQEGLVNNYSLSFQTYDGTSLTTALRLDGNNLATFAGGITTGASITVAGDGFFNGTKLEGDSKEIIRYSDGWLRLNPANEFGSGIYCGSGILRTDGTFQVGGSGTYFNVTSAGVVSSGAITSSGPITVNNVNDTYNFKAIAGDADSWFGVYDDANNSANIIVTRSDGATSFQHLGHSGATTISGTISSGAITSTGKVQGNSLKAHVGTDDGSQLNLFANASGHCFIAGHTLSFNTGSNSARTTKLLINSTGDATFSGNISHQGLTPTAGTDIDQIYTGAQTLTIGTSWGDTGIDAGDLATGTYLVQLQCNDAAVGGAYSMIYSGTMSWANNNTNDTAVDEIVLHRAGHASVGKNLFLRVQYTVSADVNNLKLQIRGNYAATGSSTYTFKFRRMI